MSWVKDKPENRGWGSASKAQKRYRYHGGSWAPLSWPSRRPGNGGGLDRTLKAIQKRLPANAGGRSRSIQWTVPLSTRSNRCSGRAELYEEPPGDDPARKSRTQTSKTAVRMTPTSPPVPRPYLPVSNGTEVHDLRGLRVAQDGPLLARFPRPPGERDEERLLNRPEPYLLASAIMDRLSARRSSAYYVQIRAWEIERRAGQPALKLGSLRLGCRPRGSSRSKQVCTKWNALFTCLYLFISGRSTRCPYVDRRDRGCGQCGGSPWGVEVVRACYRPRRC